MTKRISDDEYYSRVKAMGLRSTHVPSVWLHVKSKQYVNVQEPRRLKTDRLIEEALSEIAESVKDL